MPTRTALLAGASGLVGGHLLARLLADPRYDRVTALVRRPLDREHPRLDVRIVDFATLTADEVPAVDDVYCALGTTIRKAGSQTAFRAVDHDATLAVADRAHGAGARRIALCSSVGADPASRNFYLRVKGDVERDIIALGYDSTLLFRPSLLLGERTEQRTAERLAARLGPVFGPLCAGPLRPYRPVAAGRLAAAMVNALATAEPGTRALTYEDIVLASEAR
ncbi:NAD(P)H-binding protein [Streptomyces uncialis]|uniref:NAD(P)-binding domain-containing protein n=1 Tax=Streptomyces uncialis TaxID=1048205 RepID=A0A1Q4UYH5_9ACTN|nr:NAD(P)H-binding protein [Streptomyces uncialis]OKH90569.1 hypothetical protein AB852_33605 [Streptomyces uncialis]